MLQQISSRDGYKLTAAKRYVNNDEEIGIDS